MPCDHRFSRATVLLWVACAPTYIAVLSDDHIIIYPYFAQHGSHLSEVVAQLETPWTP